MKKKLLLTIVSLLMMSLPSIGQQSSYSRPAANKNYLMILDDARFDVGVKMVTVFALDDRARLSSNPHFQAMWNLLRLGASLEALLQGENEPANDVDLGKKFGQNGYNRTVLMLFFRFGFGESSDVKLQKHFLELGLGPGYFKEGNGGMNIHFDYRYNVAKTKYGVGGNSISRPIDYEIFAGARIGFDWSARRSESEAGFFSHLNNELKRVAEENDLTASQLILLESLAEDSKILLPGDVGGRAFHTGPIAGARVSTKILRNTRFFLSGMGFYDLMDLTSGNQEKENKRSQHHFSLNFGLSVNIGAEGEMISFF